MDRISTDGFGAPVRWMLAFRRETETWWVRLLAWGEFKHVRAFAFVAETDTWIFYDVGWGKTTVVLARGAGARKLMLQWTQNAAVLAIEPQIAQQKLTWKPFLCTTSVAHLVGLNSGAFRPDALYRVCKRRGAIEVSDDKTSEYSAV